MLRNRSSVLRQLIINASLSSTRASAVADGQQTLGHHATVALSNRALMRRASRNARISLPVHCGTVVVMHVSFDRMSKDVLSLGTITGMFARTDICRSYAPVVIRPAGQSLQTPLYASATKTDGLK